MRLFKSFANFADKIAIDDGEGKSFTYKKLLIEFNKIKKKIKSKSLILIISENSIGSLLAYIFCIINNHVAIIIDSKTKKKRYY
jgi:acyl-CoA synthetase (AMP-forming)/AMP-acid ligase II